MKTRGMLFVFEGPDGVGKSTLARDFTAYLVAMGIECKLFAFPGHEEGSLGAHVYRFHHEPETFGVSAVNPTSLQLLHIAAHIDEINSRIIPCLERGQTIILDRFWWSTWVYGLTSGVSKGALELMIDIELHFWRDHSPTRLFLVDRARPLRDDISDDVWNKLRATYYELQDRERYEYPIEIINNDSSIEQTLNNVVQGNIMLDALKKTLVDENDSYGEQNPVQLNLDFLNEPLISDLGNSTLPSQYFFYSALSPAIPTEVFDTYWLFAAERQRVFFRRAKGEKPPCTDDAILSRYKFTNAYRASDRVSQFLIRNVIYSEEQSPDELFFRILLFKIFNKISTWELLQKHIGHISYAEYSFDRYDQILAQALSDGIAIFSAAYIMPSGKSSFGFARKHRNYLRLIELMIEDDVPYRLMELNSMREAFELIRSYPTMGDFLAYQYVIDLNYSILTNFSENEFVVPGPGAKDGIRKCFDSLGGLTEADIIQLMMEQQEQEFARLEINFPSLWGRPLQLIDCQNLFCEVDKYARVAHPHIKGLSGRKRIKQSYKPNALPIRYWYPPKWNINRRIENGEWPI